MPRGALAVALVLSLAGVARGAVGITYPTGPDPATARWSQWPYPTDCGGLSFDPVSAFGGSTEAETGTGGPELALRSILDQRLYPELPRHYWRTIAASESVVEFASGRLETSPPYWLAFELSAGKWSLKRKGNCVPHSLANGLEAARWSLDGDAHLRPTSRTIPVQVTEGSCTGGANPNPRVLQPGLAFQQHRLVITLWVTPLPPGARTCEERFHPPYLVKLPRALGDRSVWNGATYPPREESSRRSLRLHH